MNIQEFKDKCLALQTEYEAQVKTENTAAGLEALKVAAIGRKGALTDLLKSLKDFSLEDKKAAGPLGNDLKKKLEELFESKEKELKLAQINEGLAKTEIDLTLPGKPVDTGHKHPLSIAQERMTRVLSGLGFIWAEGPQVEEEKYNFDMLNIPLHHPARDMQDTFFIKNSAKQGLVLRTHTSGVQVRYMEKNKPPLRIMSPGRVFRKDDVDATHSPVFHQIEGLYVDKNVSLATLKTDLTAFMKGLFGGKAEVRFRPSFFPFVEPGVEVDVKCPFCGGNNNACTFCKGTGWKEMLGAGVVHPEVLRGVGIDPEQYSGYAFGMGVERLAMLMLNIKDMRQFYDNDMRILKQF